MITWKRKVHQNRRAAKRNDAVQDECEVCRSTLMFVCLVFMSGWGFITETNNPVANVQVSGVWGVWTIRTDGVRYLLFLGVKEEKNSFLADSQGTVRAGRPDILLVLRIKEQLLSNDRLHCGRAVGSSLWLSYFLSSSPLVSLKPCFYPCFPHRTGFSGPWYWTEVLLLPGWCFCGRRARHLQIISRPFSVRLLLRAGSCACTLQWGLRSESNPTRIDVLQIDGSCCFSSVPEQNVSPPLCSEQNPHFRLFPMSAL